MTISLLPSNSTPFERAIEQACSVVDVTAAPVTEMHGLKYHRPLNVTVAPYLVLEYGLAPIAEFFGTIEELIEQGRPWQRIRGTPRAKHMALAWIGYDAIAIEDQNAGRRRWHLQTIDMGELPTAATEDYRLGKAEYLVGLSNRARTVFFRGFHGYDVRGLSFGKSVWGNAIWGDDSGVRINGGSVKWSHGREHRIAGTIDPQVYVDLGLDFQDGDSLTWNAPLITWETPGIAWNAVTDADAARAWYVTRQTIYFAIRNAAGQAIGYARCFDVSDITGTEDFDDGSRYLKLAAVIPFESAAGQIAKSVGIVIGATAAAGVKPAKRWFAPSELVFPAGETELFAAPLEIDLMKTCRELITAVVEI